MNTKAELTHEQIEALKAAALAATPQDIDSAQEIDRYDDGSHYDCPVCSGEGSVPRESEFCNYDGEALGVQFYGVGNAVGTAEAYFRAVKPATVLALIERLERAEAALSASTEAAPRTYTTQPGESVMGIAHRECGNEAEWRHILACNPQFAALLPHDYFPVGTVLTLPIQKKPLPALDLEPVVSDELHPDTAKLVRRFARALGNKLLSSQRKYGYSNEWASDDWIDRCREDLIRHVRKGDPRDVAAYCAFLWHHDQSTVPAANLPDLKLADELLDERIKAAEQATGIYWFVPDDSERYLWRTINTDQQRKFARALLRASDSATASDKEGA